MHHIPVRFFFLDEKIPSDTSCGAVSIVSASSTKACGANCNATFLVVPFPISFAAFWLFPNLDSTNCYMEVNL